VQKKLEKETKFFLQVDPKKPTEQLISVRKKEQPEKEYCE
jgi:hypothetical protein